MTEELSKSMAEDIVSNALKNAGIIENQDALIKAIAESIQATYMHAREIGRLEANRSPKLPTEIPEERFIDVRDERGELVRFVEFDWLKQTMEANK